MAANGTLDTINPGDARGTLAGLFRERVRRSPDKVAYRQFNPVTTQWETFTWMDMAKEVARWQMALEKESLQPGDRVAVLLRNCHEWVVFDQAALGCGLVVVPLYTDDRAENIAYIINDAQVKLLLMQGQQQWLSLQAVLPDIEVVTRFLTFEDVKTDEPRLLPIQDWLADGYGEMLDHEGEPDTLATIVYTSGTTGRPKGVMLSHANILWNAHASQELVSAFLEDEFLSFLPLSHTFERTVGYYLTMMAGATVSYARSIPELSEDMQTLRPTAMISVPRIFERIYNRIQGQLEDKSSFARGLFLRTVTVGWRRFQYQQGRASWSPVLLLWPILQRLVSAKVMAKLGGRLRLAICGGAPLSASVAEFFVGLGLPLIQGYGMTETSPVISANKETDNDPASVGIALRDVQIRIGENDELLSKSPGVMMGYWNNPEATAQVLKDGWMHTGDKALVKNNHIYITGRIKDVLVLSNGEKVPPADMEMAMIMDTLFDQVMVIGDNRPYLSALVVLNPETWEATAKKLNLDPKDSGSLQAQKLLQFVLGRIGHCMREFPGYAQVRRVACSLEPWTVDDGLITPTLKTKRAKILEYFHETVEKLYEGH